MLIGLCGAAGCGKGSVAGFLAAGESPFVEIAFADPLYAAVSAITGLPVASLRDRETKERPIEGFGKSPRELLQLLGTEFGRKMIGESIWVDRAMRTVEHYQLSGIGVVISDVRFDNEAEAIRERGGVVWRVVRNAPSCLSEAASQHESEGGIRAELIDLTVRNNGSLVDLRAAVDTALQEAAELYT